MEQWHQQEDGKGSSQNFTSNVKWKKSNQLPSILPEMISWTKGFLMISGKVEVN